MALTPYALEQSMTWAFTSGTATRPASLYVAAHIGPTNDTGTTNEETIGNDPDYVRQPITFGASFWNSALSWQIIENNSSFTFTPNAAAGTSTYYAFSIWDAADGGNSLAVLPFETFTLDASNAVPLSRGAGTVSLYIFMQSIGAGLTEYGAQLCLDWLFTASSLTRPTAWWLSMHTANPGTAGTANELLVAVDADYVRKSDTLNTPTTITGKYTTTENVNGVSWTPAAGSVYTTTHFGLNDASSGGNSLFVAPATTPRDSSSVISLGANELKLQMIE